MNNKEPKRFTSKVEITPVNPFEANGSSSVSSNEGKTSASTTTTTTNNNNCNKPTPSNVRQIPITTDQPFGSDFFVGSPSRLSQTSNSTKTSNHEYQSPQTNRKQQPHVHYIPIFVEGSKEPIMPKNLQEAPVEQKSFCTSDSAVPKRQSDVTSSSSSVSTPNSTSTTSSAGQTPFCQRPIPLGQQQTHFGQQSFGQEREVPVEKPTPAAPAATSAFTATPQAQVSPPQPSPPVTKPDPLRQVQEVQQEVDSLTRRVEQFSGASRADKDYLYLDEMLTRNLIKLDLIEVAGNEELRTARKNVIRCIQQAIALLESKVPTASENNGCMNEGNAAESSPNSLVSPNPSFNSPSNATSPLNETAMNGCTRRGDENAEKTN